MERIKEVVKALEQSLQRQAKNIENLPLSTFKCKTCEDTGYYMDGPLASECWCAVERRVQFTIPKHYRNASLLNFTEDMRAFASNWLIKPTIGLFITGSVGCGKTYLAAAMTRSLVLMRESNVRFDRFSDFYARLREAYRTNSPEETAWGNLAKVRWLFMDDLGAGGLTDHERRATLDLLDKRYNAELTICVNSNWSLEQVAEKMDERIADRLHGFTQLKLRGESRRGKEA